MEQNIEYTGMTSQPSDYACGDGEMKLAVNAEYRDGGYHAVRVPKDVEFKKEGFEPLFVHRTSTLYDLYVGVKKSGMKWLLTAMGSTGDSVEFTKDFVVDSVDNISGFASTGNLLSCVVNGHLYYFRYNNTAYEQIQIDSKLNPVLYFAANRSHFIPKELNNFKQIYTITDTLEGQFNIKPSLTDEKLDEGLNAEADNAYIGLVYKRLNNLKKENALVFPVLARYAVKMYDGNYCYISPPILVYPFTDVLNASFKDSMYSDDSQSVFVTNPVVEMTSYSIAVKIENSEFEKLKEFEKLNGLISGIDFFLSKELYTYDLAHIYAYRDASGENHVIFRKKIDWKKEIDNVSEFYLVKSYSLSDLLDKKAGIYWNLLEGKTLTEDVVYDSLESYTERERLDDSKTTGYNLLCDKVYSYNNRLLTIGKESDDREPFLMSMFLTPIVHYIEVGTQRYEYPLPEEMEMENLYAKCNELKDIRIIKKDKGERVVLQASSGNIEYLPIYYYYPQSGCSDLVIQDEGKIYNYGMKDCDFINGSQCILDKYNTDYTEMPSISNRIYDSGNVVKISETNNPFVFKDGNNVTCGNGKIISLAIFAREVSQGQFGEYPILAFCSDGTYAIGVGADGGLKTCSPYSYDIISNKESIANIERSIVFVSNQGLIMFGDNGRQLLLSADRTSTYAYDQGKNDHQKTFVENFLKGEVMGNCDAPRFADLYTYLTSGAKMAYDYPHGRLIVYNPAYDYSYVMETKSGMWSIMNKSFSRSLNVYEKCLLVDKDGETVYDYSSDDVIEEQKAYLITRPFKFGGANAHKSVQSIIQRGVFCDKEDVKQCLYASNDLQNWVPVKSSNSIYMRGMRGTGYKYYRSILFLPEFKQDEVLHGASVTFEPRMTNKVR